MFVLSIATFTFTFTLHSTAVSGSMFFFLANTHPKVWITSIEQYFWRTLAFLPSSFSQKLSYFVC